MRLILIWEKHKIILHPHKRVLRFLPRKYRFWKEMPIIFIVIACSRDLTADPNKMPCLEKQYLIHSYFEHLAKK